MLKTSGQQWKILDDNRKLLALIGTLESAQRREKQHQKYFSILNEEIFYKIVDFFLPIKG